jgi:hypothetical protein
MVYIQMEYYSFLKQEILPFDPSVLQSQPGEHYGYWNKPDWNKESAAGSYLYVELLKIKYAERIKWWLPGTGVSQRKW